MSQQMISMFATKVTDLLMTLITSHFEEFSNELLKKIKNKDIDSIDDIRNLWNSKCKDNIINVNNTSLVLKLNKDEDMPTKSSLQKKNSDVVSTFC